MTISHEEQERIRGEELIRLEVRKELQRKRIPRLFALMVAWATILVILVIVSAHLHF